MNMRGAGSQFLSMCAYLILSLALISVPFVKKANALCIPLCVPGPVCQLSDCQGAAGEIKDYFKEGMKDILIDNDHSDTESSGDDFNGQFNDYESWLIKFFGRQIYPALQSLTTQLSIAGMHQMFVLGTFFDAEAQLGTQRLFQKLEFEAHRDYQPSKDFCMFGTNVRSMAATEARARYKSQAINARQMSRHLGTVRQASAATRTSDKQARWNKFKKIYCDPQDNYWNGSQGSGLEGVCKPIESEDTDTVKRPNRDIDYTLLIDNARTLEVNFAQSKDLTDILALGNNIYGHDVLPRYLDVNYNIGTTKTSRDLYFDLRSVAARRNVAENSYNAIVELKTSGTEEDNPNNANTSVFLSAILKELGLSDSEISKSIGENPSYYAQLEILSKKIYQNPDFYANLYDKPANIARKAVALRAIEVMLDRAIYESQLRREMSTSVLLSTKLRDRIKLLDKVVIGRDGG